MEKDNKRIDPEQLQYVIDCMPLKELLAQLAEEASELAQAALKLRRVYDRTNPTPVPEEEAFKHLQEEIADVWLTLKALGLDEEPFVSGYQERMAEKAKRWVKRLDGNCDE